MRLAPIGAFGAMAFTIGRYGIGTLAALGKLMASCLLHLLLLRLRRPRRDRASDRLQPVEVPALHPRRNPDCARHLIVRVGAAANHGEARAPRLFEAGGRPRRPHRLFVQPRRHLDLHDDGRDLRGAGQQRDLSLGQELGILGILLLTSKGAAAVTGSGFITLAATLAVFPTIPIGGLALLRRRRSLHVRSARRSPT